MVWPAPLPLNSSRAVSTVACAIVFPSLAAICVVLRFFARYSQGHGFGADDWIILAALVAVSGQMIIILLSTIYGGVGHHVSELNGDNFVAFFKLIAAVQFTFGSSLGLVKISIALLLVRIFFVRTFRILGYCVAAFAACWMLMVWFIGAGLCRPFAYNWDKSIEGGQCGDLNGAYISIAAIDIISDVMLITLPMPWVWHLKVSTSAKIGLSFVFALGLLDIIVAILRIYYLINTGFSPDSDFTWTVTDVYVWSVIEPCIGVMVACIAIIGPFVRSKLSSTAKSARERSAAYRLDDSGKPHSKSRDRYKDEYLLQTQTGVETLVQAPSSEGLEDTTKAHVKADGEPSLGDIRVRNDFEIRVDEERQPTIPSSVARL